ELARRECARELGLTGGACEARHSKARAAHGAIHRWPAGGGARHQTTSSRTLPIMQSMFRTPAPDPTVLSLTPFVSTSPILVCALMRTLDVRSRRTLTSPIWQRMELSPPSRRPVASMLPAATDSFTGPANPLTTQLPAWTSVVTGPLTPSMVKLPACTLVRRASAGFMRTVSLRLKLKPGMLMRAYGRLNSKDVPAVIGDCSMYIVSPSCRAECGPSATAKATEGSPMISALPNRVVTSTCLTATAAGAATGGADCCWAVAGASREARRAAPSSGVMLPAATWPKICLRESSMHQ